MELLRVLRKSVVFIAIFLGIIIWLSIFKINNTNDKKVYAYYNQLMYEYANQTEMIESLTYSKYVHDKTDDYEADREYIEEAIKLLQEKYQYVYSSDMSRAENNYKKIINSTLFAEKQSYYVLNAQKYMADLESRGEINFSITNTTAIDKLVSDKQLSVIFLVMMIFVLITFMEEFEKQKGIAFFLIYFSADNVFYYLTLRKLQEFWNRMEAGGRKSFRRDELDEEFYLTGKNGFLVPYLDGIQKDLQLRD